MWRSISAGEKEVSLPGLLFTNPVILLNLKFFESQFTYFLKGDNNACFMGLLWELNDTTYVVHQTQSATYNKQFNTSWLATFFLIIIIITLNI